MPEPHPDPLATGGAAVPDWEAFYRDYRKPGYVEGFEITSKLGGGMFGLVFRARRMSIGKDYAIKFLKVDDAEVRRAIVSELEQVNWFAQIDHANLVAIEDRGEVDGIPYLVMAFAGSETLRDRMPVDANGNGLVPDGRQKAELLSCFLQCCRGLSALHERGLVHFDLKPANVFLKGSVARLGDYGLSKLVTHSRGSLSMGRGTPYYMAPEMLQRRGDHRSDVYSLGVMLYELLCGVVPFRGDSEWAVLRAHEAAEPDWPPHLTAVERAVLQRCLAKDPAQRFQSVQDLIVALGAPIGAGSGALVEARSPSPTPARKPSPPKATVEPPPLPAGRAWPIRDWGNSLRGATRRAARLARDAARRASREARHASPQAVRVVRENGRRVADRMRRAWPQAVRVVRENGRRVADRMRHAWPQAVRVVRENGRRVADCMRHGLRTAARRARPFVIGFGALAAGCVLLLLFFIAGSPQPGLVVTVPARAMQSDQAVSIAEAPIDSARASRLIGSEPSVEPLFGTYFVPSTFHDLVSTSEPRWAQVASKDPAGARRLLLEHIERLRARAPLTVAARQKVDDLPRFVARLEPAPQIVAWVQQFATSSRYDAGLAGRIVAAGPTGLLVVAQAMEQLAWQDARDLTRARHLHRLLAEATACKDLRLVERAASLQEQAVQNRQVGMLWRWFVNEFAGTERAWQAYRSLLRLPR